MPPAAEKRERPEDKIPDYPQNKAVREFLKRAPEKPGKVALGMEQVLNQCWRCKLYGHRTGSRECPYFMTGNLELEAERQLREDPMQQVAKKAVEPELEQGKVVKQKKLEQLQDLLKTVTEEERKRKEEKKSKKKKKKKKKEKKTA